jgi:predicted secreted protein
MLATTTGIVNGTAMALYVDGVKVAVLTGNDLDTAFPTRETANKDSGIWMTRIPTRGNWSFSGSAFFQFLTSSQGGYLKLFNAMKAKTRVYAEVATKLSGDGYFHGYGYITALPGSFPDDEASTFNITIEGDGELLLTDLT